MLYLLTGDEFDAAAAHRMGLVQEIVPSGRQLERAIEIAGRIASQAPLAVSATLASAQTRIREGFPAAVAELSVRFRRNCSQATTRPRACAASPNGGPPCSRAAERG
jgi:enoyl-CoA hydratase